MRIDIKLLGTVETGLLQGVGHGYGRRLAVSTRSCIMESVAGVAESADLGIDVRTALFCMFIFFKDHNAGTLTHHKSLTALVKWQGGRHRVG